MRGQWANFCVAAVLAAVYTLAHAAAGVPADDSILGYDFRSLALAAFGGFVVGTFRSLAAMSRERVLIADVFFRLLADGSVGLISTGLAFALIAANNAGAAAGWSWPWPIPYNFTHVPRDVAMLMLIGAAASGGWLPRFLRDVAEIAATRLKAKIRGQDGPISGELPPNPPSA